MTSALNTKINSYSLQFGIEFDEAYSLTPTVTGSIGTGFTQTWSLTGNAPTYEAGVGPLGGSGSWKYQVGPSFGSSRFRNTTSALMQSLNDKDFSIGFWVKVIDAPPVGSGSPLQTWQLSSNAGYLFSTFNDGGTLKFLYNGPSGAYLLPDAINLNQWYYFAARRTPFTTTLYVDGVLKETFSYGGLSNNGTSLNFGQVDQGFDNTFYISNWYLAPTSVITATEISEIWNTGSIVPRTVKYYDGTTWVNSTAQKVYNGTAWVDWDAKRFDGTSWVAI